MTKIFHGHRADCKPVAHSVQVCSCVITHLCAYKAQCCLIQPFFPSCGSEGPWLSISHTPFLSLWCVAFGHVIKKAAQTFCILGLPREMGVLDCEQSIFPLMDCACCRALFLWDMVLHQWCPVFRDSVVVLSSGVLYAGHFWHQNGRTILVTVFFIQLSIIVTNLRKGVLRWRHFTSPVWCEPESPNCYVSFHMLQNHVWEWNLVCDTQLLIVKVLWVHIDWCQGGSQSQYE